MSTKAIREALRRAEQGLPVHPVEVDAAVSEVEAIERAAAELHMNEDAGVIGRVSRTTLDLLERIASHGVSVTGGTGNG